MNPYLLYFGYMHMDFQAKILKTGCGGYCWIFGKADQCTPLKSQTLQKPGCLQTCWTIMMTMTLTPNQLKAGIELAAVRSRFQQFAACLIVTRCLKSLKCNHPMAHPNPRVTPKTVIVKRTKRLPGIEKSQVLLVKKVLLIYIAYSERNCFTYVHA